MLDLESLSKAYAANDPASKEPVLLTMFDRHVRTGDPWDDVEAGLLAVAMRHSVRFRDDAIAIALSTAFPEFAIPLYAILRGGADASIRNLAGAAGEAYLRGEQSDALKRVSDMFRAPYVALMGDWDKCSRETVGLLAAWAYAAAIAGESAFACTLAFRALAEDQDYTLAMMVPQLAGLRADRE